MAALLTSTIFPFLLKNFTKELFVSFPFSLINLIKGKLNNFHMIYGPDCEIFLCGCSCFCCALRCWYMLPGLWRVPSLYCYFFVLILISCSPKPDFAIETAAPSKKFLKHPFSSGTPCWINSQSVKIRALHVCCQLQFWCLTML